MGDNPMYWPGHQRPAWHQPPPPPGQSVNSMGHFTSHPGSMLPNPMASSGMPSGDPSSAQLQMQSSIASRHQPHQGSLPQHQASSLTSAPPGPQSYPSMMSAPAIPSSVRPTTQLNSNSHLSSSTTQGIPPHPQSHYPHQYSSLTSSYWNPNPMNSQTPMGQMNPSSSSGNPQSTGPPPQQQPDASNAYHSTSASPLTMANEGMSNISNPSAPSFHSPKDLQSADHMMTYDRQRGSMAQHPSAMMSQNVPSSTASNISPTQQGQLGMQGRLQSQPQIDSMRSMSQQPTGWSNSYYGSPNQAPYMSPYMPYPGANSGPSHAPQTTRPTMTQKLPVNGSDRVRTAYPPHSNIYGQPPPSLGAGSTNGSYYSYDSYYGQVASQPPSDPYLPHASSASSQQHWPSTASNNQMIGNSVAPPGPIQPALRPQAAANNSNIHPQSPSSASTLPALSTRPPPPSQTPDRSPAPTQSHAAPYPSPNQQSSSKSTSSSLAQLEQMVMPNSGQSAPPPMKSPTHRSSTSSPSANSQQAPMQYSYNSSGQGSYFTSTGTGAPPNQGGRYYSQYDPSSSEVQKPSWSDQGPNPMMNPTTGPVIVESGPGGYSQANYEGTGPYGDYAPLTTPGSTMNSSQFPPATETSDSHGHEKSDPYAIDSQTFDDYEDPSTVSKAKKGRTKKPDDGTKKERKPRAPKTPKTVPTEPQSPSTNVSNQVFSSPTAPPLQQVPVNAAPLQSLEVSTPCQSRTNPYMSPNQQSSSVKPPTDSSPASVYPQYDTSGIEPQKSSWSEQPSSVPIANSQSSNPVDGPSSAYVQESYDGNNTYNDYTLLSTSSANTNQPTFPAPSEITESQVQEKSETQANLEAPPAEVCDEPVLAAKAKKGKAKKSDDQPKKERKPRASRAAKNNASAQPLSPSAISTTPVPSMDQSSTPDLTIANPPHGTSPTTMGSEFQHAGTRPSGYSAYDSSVAEVNKPWTSDPSVGNDDTTATQPITGQPNYEGSQTYSEYATLSSTSNNVDRSQSQEDNATVEPGDKSETPTKEQRPEDKSDSASGSKPKKSRAKKTDGKQKRERKPKAPKTPSEVQEQQPSTSPALQPDLSVTESLPSQPASESTPSEPKPKRIRVRDPSSKGKKKLPKFALKFAKTKKRKRLGSSDNDQSDLDKTPPPSPDEVESGVQKRRSARNTKKLKYNEDIGLGFSDSDDEGQILPKSKKSNATAVATDGDSITAEDSVIADEPTVFAAPVEDTMVVEKIMATRMGKRELEPEPGEVLPPDGTFIDVEEFYVKYKNLSYLHCDWRTLEELERGDRRVAQKVKRYKQKKDSSNMFSFMDEEVFDPQYCEVDRILAVNEVEEMVPDSDDDEAKTKSATETPTQPIESQSTTSEATKNPENVISTAQNQAEPETKPMDLDDTESKSDLKLPAEQDKAATDTKAEDSESKATSAEVPDKHIDTDNPDDVAAVGQPIEQTNTTEAQPDSKVDSPKTTAELETDKNDDPKQSDASSSAQITVEKSRKMKKKVSRHYLVKWRGLSYEDSTWELEDDLDPDKIKHFMRFKDPPPKSKWKAVKRPKPEEWVRKEVSPVYKNNNTLREYQLEGINWLSFCWHQGRNCILADEMGLGKTIQSIAFVNEIYQYGINGPFLIIVPLSTVGNWAREFETWTDLNVITYHGSSTSREMLKEYEMFYRNEQGNRITSYYKFQVMITTFEIILSDCLDLREIPWKCCIIDEAHRLKNRNCKLLEGLRLLNMDHRVLLTGTPLQNNVEELFSLLNFLEPTQFSSTEQFLQEFGDLKTEAQVDKLKVILKPMMLRRLKEDVEKSLAPKEETIVEVELTNIQKKYYRAILEKNFSFLSKGSTNNNMPNLMNTMMELRKCCIHPYLINGAEEQIMYEAKQAKLAGGEPMNSYQAMVNSSGKLVLIDKLLPRLRADGHRVLIFSQMVRCLDILEDYVTHKHYPFERIDGRVRGSDRQQAIDRFSKPGSDRFVFLLCTRAGGLGINLTAADTVIIFDSDWNPQNDLQAQARCHRIGQSKAVKIYRLICRNTYEREMFDKASLKLGLDKAVLQSMNTQKGGSGGLDGQLTKKEIEELLRKGAYGALMDDDNAGDKFCEEDIDQILQRRTQVITIDNSEAKGSTFSKATFSSSNNREDIELDDPNFWEKWAKKANIESDEMRGKDELIQLAPRRRTQTKRYGADGNLIDMSDLESSDEDEETISMRTRGSRSGRQTKLTPSSSSKRSKRSRFLDNDDDEFAAAHDGGYWSKSDCFKVENGLLTYGWGRWEEIISASSYKRPLTPDDCESICRVILLYCLNSYKGSDEKIKSFAWELIVPPEATTKSESESDVAVTTRGRKPKVAPIQSKKSIAEEITDAKWTKEAKHDPLIALPDDQYRRHLQRNCNRLLVRVKYLHYLKNDILRDYHEQILADCNAGEIDLPTAPVDGGELPANWWDDEADKSLLVGIFKHGHDKFNLIRQDPCLCFLSRCGPPNKDELIAEMSCANKSADDFEEENRDSSAAIKALLRKSVEGQILDELINTVVKDVSGGPDTLMRDLADVVDENKNSILKSQDETMGSCENGVSELSQTRMEMTDDESSMNDASIDATVATEANETSTIDGDASEFLPFPAATELNSRFRRLITAHQRNFKKLEIKLAQKARDELKKERTSKFEAAKNEREERKRSQAQKWSRREEGDFSKVISFFGVEYLPEKKRHDWNKFRSIAKLDKKMDETLEEYYKAFVIMCKKVTARPLTSDEEKCPIVVEAISEERAAKCLSRIEFFAKIRERIIQHPKLDDRLKKCQVQSDLPDWWENGLHDRDLLLAACKHGLYRLDYNLAHDPTLSFDLVIKQKVAGLITSPPSSILIPLEQLQDLLERNGIEYIKDLDLQDNSDDVKAVLDMILDIIESEELGSEAQPNKSGENSMLERSLLSSSSFSSKTPPKNTRSSTALANSSSRPLPNILSKRSANTVVKSDQSVGSNSNSVRLTSNGDNIRYEDRRVVEITPIMPDQAPEDVKKSHEAGEVTITVMSESALLRLDDRDPIILLGASHPITTKIRWPKDKAIQTRLENLIYLVEKNEWPSPPKPSIPTITLPNHLTSTSTAPTTSIGVTTSSPLKSDKLDISLGSPQSDISNISSRASKHDLREEPVPSRGKRGRGRRPKQPDTDNPSQDTEPPNDDRQAAAKLRNLLSQGSTSSSRSSASTSERTASKSSSSKQGSGLSSLLAPSKQKSGGGSVRRPDDKNQLDLNAPGVANLLPQILANMKPEFRDLLASQDAAQLLLSSLSGMTGAGSIVTALRSSSATHLPNDALLTQSRPSKGPPPAHQPPSAHGSTSTRESRRSSQHARENSPPSINLRSTRGKTSLPSIDHSSQQKLAEVAHGKSNNVGRKRGRPSSSASDSPPGIPAADILDLSSLPPSIRGAAALTQRTDSRSRRHRDALDDATRSSSSSASKTSPRSSSKPGGSSRSDQQPDKGTRTTRASKRIGSRIDALALNLQAKRMHRSGSPELSPTLPRERPQDSPQAAHGHNKSAGDHKSSRSSKAPPAAHSGSHKSGSSGSSIDQPSNIRDKSSSQTQHQPQQQLQHQQLPAASLPSQPTNSSSRQDPLAQLMANSASLLAGLNPATLGNAGDLMNQLLRKAGTNDMVKNLLNDLMKNPSLALDPNILATLTASLPIGAQGLPNFNLPTPAPTSTSLPSSSNKNLASSLLSDFKPPSSSGSQSKRSRQESSSHSGNSVSGSRHSSGSNSNLGSENRRSSSTSSTTPTTSASAAAAATDRSNMFFRNAQQQAANAALANSIMNLASQPNAASNPYGNYTNPLANPFLPFGLANLGMNNPLGMGLFPNLYMPPGFPGTATNQQQQQTHSTNQSGGSSDGGSKDKKMRYPRK